MTFPLFTSITRSPESDPSAGASSAAASPANSASSGDPAGASGDSSANQPPAAAPAAAPSSLTAARAASKAAATAAADNGAAPGAKGGDNTPEQPMPWLKDGKILDGRFDRDTHRFTPEYVNENPHVRALIEAHHQTNREYSALKNGHFERLAPKDEVIESLDLSIGADGKLPKATQEALLGKPVTAKMLDLLAEMSSEVGSVRTSQFESWTKSVDERHGEGAYKGAFEWAASDASGISDEELAEIEQGLNSKTLRDATIDMLHSRYQDAVLSGKYQPGGPNAPIGDDEKLEVSNSAGGGQPGGDAGVFDTPEECYAAMPDRQLEPEKFKAWERKMERSPAVKRHMLQQMKGG